MTKDKELATVGTAGLPALPDPAELKEIFRANFEGVQPSFEVIKIPAGGSTTWEIPNDTGETDAAKELIGVILDHYATRAYFDNEIGNGVTVPPVCFSMDGKRGSLPRNENGEFGECGSQFADDDPRKCKWARFKTAVKNGQQQRGQACGLKHRVFILLTDPDRGILPYMLQLSTISATRRYEGSFTTFTTKLAGKLKKVSDITVRVKLIKDRNTDQQEFSKTAFFTAGDLGPEDKKKVEFLQRTLGELMRNRPMDVDEGEETGEAKAEPWDEG